MLEPARIYDRRKQAYEKLLEKQQRAASRLSNDRLFTVGLGLAVSYLVYRTVSHPLGVAVGFVTLVLFSYLALRHQRVRRRLKYAEALSGINRKGTERVSGRWAAFPDAGAEFRDDDHPFASDLDLFGQGSLFQWINSAQTALGREWLARVLKLEAREPLDIVARQAAVTELARKLAWRQRFESEGLLVREKLEPTAPLLQWALQTNQTYLHPLVRLGVRLLPAITIFTITLYAYSAVPWQVPTLLVVVQGLLLRHNGKERSHVLSMVYRFEASLRTYSRMLRRFEGQQFDTPWLRERQGRLRDAAGRLAFEQIHRLSTIAERISNRENAMFLIVNILILWDYQCMVALEEWKKESGKSLRTWLEVLAEIEAYSSLANIRFEQPDWAMPTVVAENRQTPGSPGGLSAQKMGHPLIIQNRVGNDFEMKAPARITVITGSNMSGKSTFLRTVGINLVLAYVGAPVCAERFTCSLMRLWTAMRITDNLEQNISSFYAELLRLKRIVEAVRTEKSVCFLLDEIFKGTNSHDRHQGAKALITQLQKDGAYGLISTHDLELGELERESNGQIRNCHFREHYQGREIRFDYTLRRGISTTRNALYLIKMVGIDLEGNE
ncbi:MAG TPA: MutS family DNA mismatch repair protein [Symbiobacteriaceae bacterium]|nr:MutS family DNA mismatch repair protein [Symbiobacteriaceae bacterium]